MAPRFFLPIVLFFSHSVTVQSVIYGLKGQQVQFDPDITGQPELILCRHNGKIIVEFNGIEEQVFGAYKGRVTLNWHSAQLQISDLHLEDSGKYIYEIAIEGKLFRQSYELEVIEKVAKPTITCQMNSDSSSTVSAVLLCSVELNQPQSSLKFKWSSRGNVQHGQQLTIFLGGERDEEEYTCRVSNPLSSETATFRAKDCYTDAGSSAGMITLIVLFSILTVIVCVGLLILLWRLRRKRVIRTDEAGPAAVSDGVTEDMVSHQESCSAPQHSAHDEESQEQLLKPVSVRGRAAEINKRASKQTDNMSTHTERRLDHFGSFQREEKRPEPDKQSTLSSPPLRQLDTRKGSIRGRVAEINKMASKQTDNKTTNTERCLDHFGSRQNERKRSEPDKQSTLSSPPLRQLDTTKGNVTTTAALLKRTDGWQTVSEKEDRGAQSDARGGLLPAAQPRSPLTQSSIHPSIDYQYSTLRPYTQGLGGAGAHHNYTVKARYTVEKSPVHYRANTERQTTIQPHRQIRVASQSNMQWEEARVHRENPRRYSYNTQTTYRAAPSFNQSLYPRAVSRQRRRLHSYPVDPELSDYSFDTNPW